MASSSSSISAPQIKHDVFLSFRGEDTRDNFTSHLHAALCREKIETFIDNSLKKGKDIAESLLGEIEQSKISVIVFSRRYAGSRWCLDELVKSLECMENYKREVIPVFYRVAPTDVGHRSGKFGEAFEKLEGRFKDKPGLLQSWRTALTKAAKLSGFASKDIKSESELVSKIIEDILQKLINMSPSTDHSDLVGAELNIEKIESSLLGNCSNDVHGVGIWGIGGIGKTTIAEAVFNKIFSKFESHYFATNVREEFEKGEAHRLRKNFSSAIFGDKKINLGHTFTIDRFRNKKVLLAFDDVASFEQIKIITGDLISSLGTGSKIIITTRYEDVLKTCPLKIEVHEITGLLFDHSLKLFSLYAFGQEEPQDDYMELSKSAVIYANGVPLALKVLGSSLHGVDEKEEWQSVLEELKISLHHEIEHVLRRSYVALGKEEKKIFLDISCFYKDWDRNVVRDILIASGYLATRGLIALIKKSLITISPYNNTITVHDLIQEMGRKIARQKFKEKPTKQSRLWHHEDVYDVFTINTGAEAVQGICLDISKLSEPILNCDAFTKMSSLKFLRVYNSEKQDDNQNQLHGFEDLKSFSKKLTYFSWERYPFKSLPSNFCAKNLVRLELRSSKVEKLWDDVQDLAKLKYIDLSYSENLIELPNLSKAENLDGLILGNCKNLKVAPILCKTGSKLANLDLSCCSSTDIFTREAPHRYFGQLSFLKELDLSGNKFETISASIKDLSNLRYLNISYCKKLSSLPELPNGIILAAENCPSLESISDLSFLFSSTRRPRTVNFSNCLKLNLEEPRYKECLREFCEVVSCPGNDVPEWFRVCYPGKEVPEWFSHRAMGNSITLKYQPDWRNENFQGFIMCAVMEFTEKGNRFEPFNVDSNWGIAFEDGDIGTHNFHLGGWLTGEHNYEKEILPKLSTRFGPPYSIDADHVFLGFYKNIGCCDLLDLEEDVWGYMDTLTKMIETDSEVLVYFSALVHDPFRYKVKACGVHFLYAQEEYMDILTLERKKRHTEIMETLQRFKSHLSDYLSKEEEEEEEEEEVYSDYMSEEEEEELTETRRERGRGSVYSSKRLKISD